MVNGSIAGRVARMNFVFRNFSLQYNFSFLVLLGVYYFYKEFSILENGMCFRRAPYVDPLILLSKGDVN